MTLNNTTRSVEYPGDDTPGPFAFPFKIFEETHLKVTRISADDPPVSTVLELTTDYTVTGVGRANGSITLEENLLNGETLIIRRSVPLTQPVSLRNQGPYFPAVVEDELDRIVMQILSASDDTQDVLDTFDERLDAFDVRLTDLEELVATLLEAQEGAAIPVPTLSAIAAPTEDGGLLEWSAGISFEYQVATDSAFAEENIVPGMGAVLIENPTELLSLIRFLDPETTYYVRLRAVGLTETSDEIAGDWSNTISFTTAEQFSASGGDLVLYDEETGYSTHIFDTDGDFEVISGSQSVRALIVGAGGMGGGQNGSGVSGGGGGGGGVKELFSGDWAAIGVGIYPVVVGTAAVAPAANNVGVNGEDSSFNGQTAKGGGFGGSLGAVVGNGGCGGGAVNSSGGPEAAGRGTTGQGFDGGIGGDAGNDGGNGGGGGGGGANRLTGEGENGDETKGGDGGEGYVSDIEGANAYYGAGGGGARPVDVFGPIVGTTPGAGGIGGGGAGANVAAQGSPGTGVGSGGGGAIGNNRGGLGTNGRVVIRYFGRAADVTPIDPPAVVHGPFNFADCEREQDFDGVGVLADSNAKTDTGIYPDYREYRCDGSGDIQSSRWDPDYSGSLEAVGNDGILVFRFDEPIVYFKLTRKITAGVTAIPRFYICDNYSVRPDTSGAIPGSTADGAFINLKAAVNFPDADIDAEEDMEFSLPSGFLCVVIWQGPSTLPWITSKFKDLYFTTLAEA